MQSEPFHHGHQIALKPWTGLHCNPSHDLVHSYLIYSIEFVRRWEPAIIQEFSKAIIDENYSQAEIIIVPFLPGDKQAGCHVPIQCHTNGQFM